MLGDPPLPADQMQKLELGVRDFFFVRPCRTPGICGTRVQISQKFRTGINVLHNLQRFLIFIIIYRGSVQGNIRGKYPGYDSCAPYRTQPWISDLTAVVACFNLIWFSKDNTFPVERTACVSRSLYKMRIEPKLIELTPGAYIIKLHNNNKNKYL